MHCLPQRLKSTLFEIFSNGTAPKELAESEKKFHTTLILVFEVIVQPPKTHVLTFSSETKIMKITHSAEVQVGSAAEPLADEGQGSITMSWILK